MGRLLVLILWVCELVVLLSGVADLRFTFIEPRSPTFFALLGAFLASSACFFRRWRRRTLVWAHIGLAGFVLVLRPDSAVFGSDGALVVCCAYLVAAVAWLTGDRRRLLVLVSSLVGVLILETGLAALRRDARPRTGVGDYGDMVGRYGEGGFLVPNLDMPIVTGAADVGRAVTNEHGFRNRQQVERAKPAGQYRAIIVGDSFVAGYRTDQEATVGRQLEIALRKARPELDVLVAGAGHPAAYVTFLREHGLGFDPDLVVVGITIGNDIIQSWTARRNATDQRSVDMFLPRDAFKEDITLLRGPAVRRALPEHRWAEMLLPPGAFKSDLALLPAKIERNLRDWRWYRAARPLVWADVIVPWFIGDGPRYARLFDPGNGLGVFYARQSIDAIEQAYGDIGAHLADLGETSRASHVPVVVAFFPQRFQVRADEWHALAFEYGLDPSAFDLEMPNRRLAGACAAAGLTCVDLLPAFRAAGKKQLYLPGGDMHWNAAGHALAADVIADAVRARVAP